MVSVAPIEKLDSIYESSSISINYLFNTILSAKKIPLDLNEIDRSVKQSATL